MKKILVVLVIVFLAISLFYEKNPPKEEQIPPMPIDKGQENPIKLEKKPDNDTPMLPKESGVDREKIVSVLLGEQVVELTMEQYLYGVLAAEMPASFPEEALKAQAVAARTYTLYKLGLYEKGASPADSHKGAALCGDYRHCKAYTAKSPEEMWGKDGSFYSEKIKSVIGKTDGVYISYQDQPIVAVFHAASGPMTENGVDVWGGDTPYLAAVESPGGEHSPRYYGQVQISVQAFSDKIRQGFSINLEGDPIYWIGQVQHTAAGGVQEISIGGTLCKGTKIRTLFGLNSTNFTIKLDNGQFTFDTIGYGHGVGMSQYGARALALEGKTYKEIVKWYYKGVDIVQSK